MEIKVRGIVTLKLDPPVPTLFELCQITIVEYLGAPESEEFLFATHRKLETMEMWIQINRTALSYLIKRDLEKAAFKRFGYAFSIPNYQVKITGGMAGIRKVNC